MSNVSRRKLLKGIATGVTMPFNSLRRDTLKGIATGVTMASVSSPSPASSWAQEIHATPRKGRIKQSVSRWCYQKIPLDELCQRSAEMGLKAIDLLGVEEWEVP